MTRSSFQGEFVQCLHDEKDVHLAHRKCLDLMGVDVCLHCNELPTSKSISLTFTALMQMNLDFLACETKKPFVVFSSQFLLSQ